MARLNRTIHQPKAFTHEGAPAVANISIEAQLRRSVLSCLLWENEFYESGKTIADRIVDLASQIQPQTLSRLALEARHTFNLRHVPLLLCDVLSKTGSGDPIVSNTISQVISRADEPGELLSIFWRNGRKMVPAGMRKGICKALVKFDEYQLAKYDRDGAVKIRDVLRIVRPTPDSLEQSALWKRAKDRQLEVPDTWEVALSGGANKKETFERLLLDGKLGYLALLRNLRNMSQANVDPDLVNKAIRDRKGGAQRVLPFRYVAAARAAPQYEPALDAALHAAIHELPALDGKTIVLVDVSGSMDAKLSSKSDMRRIDAAAALASIIPASEKRVFAFDTSVAELPPRSGLAGVDAILRKVGGGTSIGHAVQWVNEYPHDRLIVITDEQSHDHVPAPTAPLAYMINVASNKNGVGYGRWIHIDGFSEGVLRYINEIEKFMGGEYAQDVAA